MNYMDGQTNSQTDDRTGTVEILVYKDSKYRLDNIYRNPSRWILYDYSSVQKFV